MRRLTITLRRASQGVGLRPLVARIADELGLAGFVRNTARSVTIVLEGSPAACERFIARLRAEAPSPGEPEIVESEASGAFDRFVIADSDESGPCDIDALALDTRVCDLCMREHDAPDDRRAGWPLIHCARCGPRFTITTALPFDRPRTTMAPFAPCDACLDEYRSKRDRRAHAQTIACPRCGPDVRFEDREGIVHARGRDALALAVARIREGEIVALMGVGGFQLLCDGTRSSAVRRLRERKRRPEQPFAALVADVEAAREIAWVDHREQQALESPAGPIVLLRAKGAKLAKEVAPGLARVGVLLPTTAAHAAIARAAKVPLVCTSGNAHGEPIVIDPREARAKLGEVADAFVVHDRAIAHRADDSVMQVIAGRARALRAGRGLAPSAFDVGGPDRLCVGAHLRAAPALVVDGRATLWTHVGDLDSPQSRAAYDGSVRSMEALSAARNVDYVCDAHPDYASTLYAEARAQREGRAIVRVLHHHAHVAAALAEHDPRGTREAFGLAWDGTGLGPDGALAGGESLYVSASGARWRWRFAPFALPGGDAASRDGRRAWVGALVASGCPVDSSLEPLAALCRTPALHARTTSVGRLFDAIAYALGVRSRSTYEGQAAMELESIADPNADEPFEFSLVDPWIDWRPALRAIVEARRTCDASRIAGRFHHTLAAIAAAIAQREDAPIVALAGGCFANALLAERCEAQLARAGRDVLFAERVPCGDGAIAIGQAWVSASPARSAVSLRQSGAVHDFERAAQRGERARAS